MAGFGARVGEGGVDGSVSSIGLSARRSLVMVGVSPRNSVRWSGVIIGKVVDSGQWAV